MKLTSQFLDEALSDEDLMDDNTRWTVPAPPLGNPLDLEHGMMNNVPPRFDPSFESSVWRALSEYISHTCSDECALEPFSENISVGR